jgi:hypothetical protein
MNDPWSSVARGARISGSGVLVGGGLVGILGTGEDAGDAEAAGLGDLGPDLLGQHRFPDAAGIALAEDRLGIVGHHLLDELAQDEGLELLVGAALADASGHRGIALEHRQRRPRVEGHVDCGPGDPDGIREGGGIGPAGRRQLGRGLLVARRVCGSGDVEDDVGGRFDAHRRSRGSQRLPVGIAPPRRETLR